ncbi:MAG: tRNA epoxyqueuosine(34) reductase QueG [Xanthomonadales bacterium]|nr:tRNA epoxyqueuosine(34) reductase QueG [Xanthomonadales bacterium]
MQALAGLIRGWGRELGFQQLGFSDTELDKHETRLLDWLAKGYHGEMDYMQRHGTRRSRPAELHPGTVRVISARMDYLPEAAYDIHKLLEDSDKGAVSRYALGRDYHKLMRKRLQTLAHRIEEYAGPFGYRVFVDSAPVLEKALAEKAGLGWIGKHSNVINKNAGSWFFLGEIFTDLPLPLDSIADNHCGDCSACLDVCPTQAIVAPYTVDARRCISYLTIEFHGSIPVELRGLMGNRVYGCDDCQLVCPWNRFARSSEETDFNPRHGLDAPQLIELFQWTEEQFSKRLEGSPIRRIGHATWLRNIAVALGNAGGSKEVVKTLKIHAEHPSEVVREHVEWAMQRHTRNM